MIDGFRSGVARQLRPVSAVEQHPFATIVRAVEEPRKPGANRAGGGALVEQDTDVDGVESAFLQEARHQERIVDAASQSMRRIGIRIDANE